MADQATFKTHLNILKKCSLFQKVNDEELLPMLACLDAKISSYTKNETIQERESPITKVGIVLDGKLQASRVDLYGNRSIVGHIETTELFGVSFACSGVTKSPLDIIASTNAVVMFIDFTRVITTCSNSCGFHNQIIANLLTIVAQTNLHYSQKIEVVSKRNTRDKLLTYLMLEATKAGKEAFSIPFDRQELADYLEVERSGLSTEISKLKREGYINCEKNRFELLKNWM